MILLIFRGLKKVNAANEAIEERRTGRTVPVSEWSRLSGYAVSAIEGQIAEGLPLAVKGGPGKPHKVDTAQAIVWLLRRERGRTRNETLAEFGLAEGADGAAPSSTAKDRLQLARARREEIEVEKLDGIVVEIETVERVMANLVLTAKSRLLAIPSGLAPRMALIGDEAEAKQLLDEAIGEALDELTKAGIEDLMKEVA